MRFLMGYDELKDTKEALERRAEKIDNRLGPIPGPDADAIAKELRAAARYLGILKLAVDALESVRYDVDMGERCDGRTITLVSNALTIFKDH